MYCYVVRPLHDEHACTPSRDAASAELELDALADTHRALVGAHAASADPELYGPLAAAMERTVSWLRAVSTEVSYFDSDFRRQHGGRGVVAR